MPIPSIYLTSFKLHLIWFPFITHSMPSNLHSFLHPSHSWRPCYQMQRLRLSVQNTSENLFPSNLISILFHSIPLYIITFLYSIPYPSHNIMCVTNGLTSPHVVVPTHRGLCLPLGSDWCIVVCAPLFLVVPGFLISKCALYQYVLSLLSRCVERLHGTMYPMMFHVIPRCSIVPCYLWSVSCDLPHHSIMFYYYQLL